LVETNCAKSSFEIEIDDPHIDDWTSQRACQAQQMGHTKNAPISIQSTGP
jgi:hypothetical protein